MLVRYHEAVFFSLLLLVGAAIYALGGIVIAGTIFPLYTNLPLLIGALLAGAFTFSFVFVLFSAGISEYLGHRTYRGGEEFVIRILRVFLIFVVFNVLAVLSIHYVPIVGPLIAFFLSLVALLAAVSVSVDGYKLSHALRIALRHLVQAAPYVAEFVVFSFILLIPLVVIDVYGGWVGALLSVILTLLLAVPWLVSEITIVYLLRYPLVISALRKIERF